MVTSVFGQVVYAMGYGWHLCVFDSDLNYLPVSSFKMKVESERRYWKIVLARYRNQLYVPLLEEGKQKVHGYHRCQSTADLLRLKQGCWEERTVTQEIK